MISHPEFVVIAFAFRFLLVCLAQNEGELNYLMINILELNQSSSDENDLSCLPSNTWRNGTIRSTGITTNLTDKTPSNHTVLTHNTQDPTTMVPTSPGENVSTFSAKAPDPQTFDPPLCSRVINITWLSFAPFISQPKNSTRQTEKLDGVFYSIIGRAVQFCCKHLGNRGTRLEYTHKAENINTLHANIFYDKASIGMPVYIENEFFDQTYGGTLAFIKVLESPGLVVIGNKDDVKQNDLKVLWKTIYNQWPIVLISVLLCAISGICVWALVSIIALFGENPNLVGINTWCLLFPLANGRFTVWANGEQNSRLVNFVQESRLLFQCTNQFLLPKNDREGLNMVSKMF